MRRAAFQHRDQLEPAVNGPKTGGSTDPHTNGALVPRHRLLGAYYTPNDVAVLITRWALGAPNGTVLDPSFGGCAFMQAAASVLGGFGKRRAGRYVYGIDIDRACGTYVHETPGLFIENCVFGDFLALSPGDVPGAPYQTIVGNPPYVRHHWLKDERRTVARRIAAESGYQLPETASLWAYFILHTFAFLRPGGRLGMLVPEAILQARYAAVVREALAQRFARVRLIHVRERLFERTDEPVVVVAGEDFGTSGALEVLSVDTVAELGGLLQGVAPSRTYKTLPNGRRITGRALKAMQRVESSPSTVSFGTLAETRIGIVTGANNFFVRSADELRKLGIPARARVGIVSRTKSLSGLEFTHEDHRGAVESGSRVLLVRPAPSSKMATGVRRWIHEGEQAGVHKRHKCAARVPWYRVDVPSVPDAFVTSTRLGAPRLVLNRARLRCTNALYAATWKLGSSVPPEIVALAFSTTFIALWSEIAGRRYGGGVLKLDLFALAKLPIPLVPGSIEIFREVDLALRRGDETGARMLADDAVLRRGLGVSSSELSSMRTALVELGRQRIL